MKGFMIVKKLSEKQGKLTDEEWQRIDQILCEECGVIAHQTIQYGDFGLKRVFRCNCGRIEKQYDFKVRENKDCEEKMTAEEREKIQKVLGLLEGVSVGIKDSGVLCVLGGAYDLLEGLLKKEGDKVL